MFPVPVDDHSRVYLAKGKHMGSTNPPELTSLWYDVYEVRLYEDFMVDDILVFDVSTFTVNDTKKLTPIFLSKFFNIYKVTTKPEAVDSTQVIFVFSRKCIRFG